LAARVVDTFQLDLQSLLFEATHFDTYIDTQTSSELAKRGKAKSKRSDLRVLGMALLVSSDSHVPLLSYAYPGNQNDAACLAMSWNN
jgi:transposase